MSYSWVAVISYNGAYFKGWQRQSSNRCLSVQAAFEEAVSRVADEPVSVVCAGRTDAGVHASGQVVHFDTQAVRRAYEWWMGINSYLPKGISVEWLAPAEKSFHARFSAVARRYFYVIDNSPVRPALQHDQLTWWRYPLELAPMQEAAKAFLGERDFSALRAKDCQAKTTVRQIQHFDLKRFGSWIIADIQANAFLYHMVRNMMGVLLPIGQGLASPNWASQVLASLDRSQAGVTAPASGLYFARAYYPEHFQVAHQGFYPKFIAPLIEPATAEAAL